MAKKIIKNPSDLPKWFFEKDYNVPDNAISWADEFNFRRYFNARILDNSKNNIKEEEVNYYLTAKPFEKSVVELDEIFTPINELTVFEVVALSSFIWNPLCEKIKKTLHECLNIYGKSRNESSSDDRLGMNKALFEYTAGEMVSEEFTKDEDYEVFETPALDEYANKHKLLSGHRLLNGNPITVNLAYSDRTLIESFSAWLKKEREDKGVKAKRPFTKDDYDKWKKYKILEVFDLDAWAKCYNIKITDSAVAKILWPDGAIDAEDISPIDRLRKITRKKIPELISDITIRRLSAQGSLEEDKECFDSEKVKSGNKYIVKNSG